MIDSDCDVLLEIFGKYCPGCMAFASKFDDLAGELKKYSANLSVVKLCTDYNFVPELSDKKPYTPIFWYYKRGDKTNPVQFKGRNSVEELQEFVRANATFSFEE